jgi:hypothetical protein
MRAPFLKASDARGGFARSVSFVESDLASILTTVTGKQCAIA